MSENEPLRMNAYYYSFDPTGERVIDVVLSAVAWAGKAHHHTQYWTDTDLGESKVAQIQRAADEAAREVAALRARVEKLETAIQRIRIVSSNTNPVKPELVCVSGEEIDRLCRTALAPVSAPKGDAPDATPAKEEP